MEKNRYWLEFVPKFIICMREGYRFSLFKQDLFAGITVGVVSLPLAMAFAIASGVSPERGLYTAIVAGFIASLLGGSRALIGGPTGAFVVLIESVVIKHGYDGLVMATLIAAILLIIMGICRIGSLVRHVPHYLVIGFTAGIGVILFSSQVKEFLGLQMTRAPGPFLAKWHAYFDAMSTINWLTTTISCSTLALIIFIRRKFPSLPWGVLSIAVMTIICILLGVDVQTIGSRFGEIPRTLPSPILPFIDMSRVIALFPDAFAIACLAGMESLLCALIADQLMGTKHRSNAELVGQGLANIGSMIFGGIPATGAIARTATNVKTGAKTPVAGMICALTVLFLIFICAPVVKQIPMAALSGVLVMVAWNMSEVHHFVEGLKGSFFDRAILLVTFGVTVIQGIVLGMTAGLLVFFIQKGVQRWQRRPAV